MPAPQFPEIFLSHSGEQKGFVWHLYRELLHAQHNPFFDQDTGVDSLPKGIPFPSRILQACRACKLGVVVLSHDYIESLWPMLELQQFFFHNPHSPYIFPLFYKLKPADLSKEKNLTRWRLTWEEKEASWKDKVQHMHTEDSGTSSSISDSQPMLDISLWPKALERLRSQSGETLPDNKDELPFIRAIVSNICKMLPPPQSFKMGDQFKGAAHIQVEIHKLFQQQSYPETDESGGRMPICVGLHGVGGSGKTTVCMYMLNFYAREYPGSCWFLQLPSKLGNENERHLLVQSMNEVLSQHGNLNEATLKEIKTVEQAMRHFQDLLRRYRVFLVVDNIWDWALLYVKQILAMDYMKDSRLLVTARSGQMLQTLSLSLNDSDARERPAMQIHHVPSISEAEAIEALKAYNLSSLRGFENADSVLGRLAKSCIFDGQCHPLLLNAVGAKLRHLGGRRHEDLENSLSRLQALKICGDDDDIEEEIVSVLKTSYDALNGKLQYILLLLGTCVPKQYYHSGTMHVLPHGKRSWSQESKWLSKVYNDSGSQSTKAYIRAQIIELEYHGLLQMDERGRVVIHDVQMMMIDNIVRGNKDAPRRFFFDGDVSTLSRSQWRSLKYVSGYGGGPNDGSSWRWAKGISDVEVLWLNHTQIPGVLHLGRMQFLRYLRLYGCLNLTEVKGWYGAPNLVSVKLERCLELEIIEPMTSLSSLKELQLVKLRSWKLNTEGMRSTLSACTALQKFSLQLNYSTWKFPSLTLTSMRVLDLYECKQLQSFEGSECGLTALEELSLIRCCWLESLPDLKQLVKLRRLVLEGLRLEEAVKVGEATLTRLEELSLEYGTTHFSTGSCSELPISAFSNLRKLWVNCSALYFDGTFWVPYEEDFDGRSLPPSLEELHLSCFQKTQEMPDLSALVNLKRLEVSDWESLTSMTGLGPLTKLEYLKVFDCPALREVRHVGPSSNLEEVCFSECSELRILSIMFGFLRRYQIWQCPMVRKEMLPDEVSNSCQKEMLLKMLPDEVSNSCQKEMLTDSNSVWHKSLEVDWVRK